jgi:glycosyltransferase involved in cell wall biosynthesis
MKILNIIQCANLGGMEQASLRLMKALQPSGMEFEVVSLHEAGALKSLTAEAGIALEGLHYWGPSGIGVIPALVSKLRTSMMEQVIMTGPHLAAMASMKIAGVKGAFLAVHFHHTGVKSPAAWRLIYRLALDRFRWVTFPSDFVRNEAMAIYPAIRQRSLTIRYPQDPPVPVDHARRVKARARLGLSEGDFVVGNAGWLIRRKRFDVFLRVASKVASMDPRAKFLIAGGGEEEGELKRLADELEISENIMWLGWLDNLNDFYDSLDVLLFNADWDALPVTPQEAVARGVPLVSSVLNSGLREVFDPSLSDRILAVHDESNLAGQILEIARNPMEAKRQAAVSRDHFMKICDPELIAEQHRMLLVESW